MISMTIILPSTEPTSSTTTLENIVFWIAALVAVAFIALAIVNFGTVVEIIKSTKQEAVTEQARLTSITSELANVQPRYEEAQAAISQSRATLSGLESEIAKKQDDLKAEDATLGEKTAAADAAEKHLAELNAQIGQAQHVLDAPINEAQKKLDDLNSQIAKRNDELNAFNEKFAALRRDAEQFTQRKNEFCSVVRVALHAGIPIAMRFRPAAEYCGLPLPGGHGPG
jgi:peptidoglycan hydrolase CwlO-like protein